MNGLMMPHKLLISGLIEHADRVHGDTEIVSRLCEGGIHRTNYRTAHRRSKQLAQALIALGVHPGECVATLAWNTHRHFECYFGISGMGAVLHTLNPRLSIEQMAYIVNHAEDRVLLFDISFAPLVEKVAPLLKTVRHFIALTDEAHKPSTSLATTLIYESLLAEQSGDYQWPQFDEETASSMCYTSGTTGNPKGALYSHRSTVLHAMTSCHPDMMNLSAGRALCPIVPMFHVNAWGTPYAATLTGAKFVLPGPQLDGPSVYELLEQERVELSLGVPTVWFNLLGHLQQNNLRLTHTKRLVIGGSACPPAQFRAFAAMGVRVLHAWGMTELSPLGSAANLKFKHLDLPADEQEAILLAQGRAPYGIELGIIDEDGGLQPHDGRTPGELVAKGPWTTQTYFKGEGGSPLTQQGYFRTGDMATINADGDVRICDRSKDMIKSGGEWISSIDLENVAIGHPAIAMAAAIGIPHPKWDERPLLICVKKPGAEVDAATVIDYLQSKVAKLWVPDDVQFVEAIPLGATGKILKTELRKRFAGYAWPTSA